jgi:carboxymethylenebutenolidase
MNRFVLILTFAFVVQSLLAQEYKDFGKDRLNSSPRHGEWVNIKSGDRTIKAFVVYPERKDKAPAVLVIQEIFGLTDWLRSMCDELAENGVIGIAPDFLNGQKFEDTDGASKAVSAVTRDQVKGVLDATADYALKIPACNGTLAVCGFCRGGGWAFMYANVNSKLKAAYSFYGAPPESPEQVVNIGCPVYGFYGENDERVNAGIPKAEELMKAAGKKIRTGNLQRSRSRIHAFRRTRQSEYARRRQESARRSVGALENTA